MFKLKHKPQKFFLLDIANQTVQIVVLLITVLKLSIFAHIPVYRFKNFLSIRTLIRYLIISNSFPEAPVFLSR